MADTNHMLVGEAVDVKVVEVEVLNRFLSPRYGEGNMCHHMNMELR